MEETRTRFCEAMPASRRASSNDVNRSLCLPTPLVKKIFFGTMLFPNFYVSSVSYEVAVFLTAYPVEFIASGRVGRPNFSGFHLTLTLSATFVRETSWSNQNARRRV